MRALLLVVILWLAPMSARAELSAITLAGTVTSFDEDTVVLKVHQRSVRVPRSWLQQQTFRTGDAVLLTLRGEQIETFVAKSAEGRSPASMLQKKK